MRTFRDAVKGVAAGTKGSSARTERDMSMKFVLIAILVLTLAVWLIPAIPVSFVGAAIVVIFGFFFATVSSRMVGLVGSGNNPVSGMAIATLLIATLILKLLGSSGAPGMQAAIAIGSIICIVSAIAGDTSQDLKPVTSSAQRRRNSRSAKSSALLPPPLQSALRFIFSTARGASALRSWRLRRLP